MKKLSLVGSGRTRRRWTPVSERERIARAWEVSGQTQSDFADANGLSVGTLRIWIRHYGAGTSSPVSAVELREINLGHLMGQGIPAERGYWEFEIRMPSGVTIKVAKEAPLARIGKLVEALRG